MFSKHNFQIPDTAIIQPDAKRLPYTITPIGSKADLIEWRKNQELMLAAREIHLAPVREARRQSAIAMVANQNAPIVVDEVSKMEAIHVKARKSTPQVRRGDLRHCFTVESVEHEPSTIKQRLIEAAKDLWNSARFDKL